MKQRLEYIDQLKGFAILTVVIGHFILFCLHEDSSLLFKLIYSFHMPLFAFLSGLMFRSFANMGEVFKKMVGQSQKLLLPFVSFGIIYMYTIRSGQDFITHSHKLGVWYLLFLWQCYLITHVYHCVAEKIVHSSSLRLLADACWLIVAMAVFAVCNHKLGQVWISTFGIMHLYALYPFFFIGYVIRRTTSFKRIFEAKNIFFDVSMILWILLFCLSLYGYIVRGTRFPMPAFAVYAIVALFYRFHNLRGGESRILNILEIFGKNSLGIYILHRFLTDTFDVGVVGRYIESTGSLAMEFMIAVPFSVLFCWLSIAMLKVIRFNRILSLILLGESIKESENKVINK